MRIVLFGMLFFLSVDAGSAEIKAPEEWRFNPRERTANGLSTLEQGDVQSAAESFDTAARLDSANPLTLFNSGTARLLAERQDAIERLEQAAAAASGELLPEVHYNVGNAHLASGNPTAAIEAYKEALRKHPGHGDAKYNLELARRLLQQQQKQQQEQQPQEDQGDEGSSTTQPPQADQPSPSEPESEEDSSPRQDRDEQRPDSDDQPDGEDPREPSEDESPLPGFDEQEDMTAEQAAAILDAVENLERQQRRQQAAERARRRARAGKDW